jgi:hypothetical protein
MYLKGELNQRNTCGGLIEAELKFFGLDRHFTLANTELHPQEVRYRRETIEFFLSGRIGYDILNSNFGKRLCGSSTLSSIKLSRISFKEGRELIKKYPILNDFFIFNSVFNLPEAHLIFFKKLLSDNEINEIIIKEISELKESKKYHSYILILREAIESAIVMACDNKIPNSIIDDQLVGKFKQEGFFGKLCLNFIKKDKFEIVGHLLKDLKDSEKIEVIKELLDRKCFMKLQNFLVSDKEFLKNESLKSFLIERYKKDQDFRLFVSESDLLKASLSPAISKFQSQVSVKDRIKYYEMLTRNVVDISKKSQEKVASCLLEIPLELVKLLNISLKEEQAWKKERIKSGSDEIEKSIILDKISSNFSEAEIKLYARYDKSQGFIMGIVDDNSKLRTGLRINLEGKLEVGRFDEKGNLILTTEEQEKVLSEIYANNTDLTRMKRALMIEAQQGIEIRSSEKNFLDDVIDLAPFDFGEAQKLTSAIGMFFKNIGVEISQTNVTYFSLKKTDNKWECKKFLKDPNLETQTPSVVQDNDDQHKLSENITNIEANEVLDANAKGKKIDSSEDDKAKTSSLMTTPLVDIQQSQALTQQSQVLIDQLDSPSRSNNDNLANDINLSSEDNDQRSNGCGFFNLCQRIRRSSSQPNYGQQTTASPRVSPSARSRSTSFGQRLMGMARLGLR